jgi:tRNA U34 5-methylaminomethyl-2-thiouridine-forming methyltransferase MnmC
MYKEKTDFRSMNPDGKFDLIYFDAFSPEKQPHLWSAEIFCKLSDLLNPGGLLVSYSAKGSVRRALTSCKFNVEKVPGPPGKREMIRATRI